MQPLLCENICYVEATRCDVWRKQLRLFFAFKNVVALYEYAADAHPQTQTCSRCGGCLLPVAQLLYTEFTRTRLDDKTKGFSHTTETIFRIIFSFIIVCFCFYRRTEFVQMRESGFWKSWAAILRPPPATSSPQSSPNSVHPRNRPVPRCSFLIPLIGILVFALASLWCVYNIGH